jgi:hypothetical protein
MTIRRLSLSYEELSRTGRDELKRLVEAGGPGGSQCDSERCPVGRAVAENVAGTEGRLGVAAHCRAASDSLSRNLMRRLLRRPL